MELLKERAVVCCNVVPATAASPTPQGLSHPRIPAERKVTAVVSLPAASSATQETSLRSAESLTDCKKTLSLFQLTPRTAWSCNVDIGELDLLSASENKLFQQHRRPHQPKCSRIKETGSKAEKLNKAVKPHFCNYVQQLRRHQNFFMSVDWVQAKRLTYSLPLFSHFILWWTTWKPWENKQLAILLRKVKPEGNWRLRQELHFPKNIHSVNCN